MDTEQAKTVEQAAEALGIKELLPTIYKDLLQPAARESGQKLVIAARAVGVALAPLEGIAWGYDQIKSVLAAQIAARLANKAPDEIKTPDKTIAGPIVMGMAFASEAPHLREMYANLLASAMYTPSAGRVHPSFVQIIQQLTPEEAKILKHLGETCRTGTALFRENINASENANELSYDSLRLIRSTLGIETKSEWWASICFKHGITDPVIRNAFFRNLVRLGILDEHIEPSSGPQLRLGERMRSQTVVVTNVPLCRRVGLSEYGNLFLDVCVREI